MQADTQGRAIQIGIWVGAPTVLSLSTASVNVQLSPLTHYRLWASVGAFFQMGNSNAVAATVNSHPLTQGLDILLVTDNVNYWLAGIVSTGTGALFISQIDARSL